MAVQINYTGVRGDLSNEQYHKTKALGSSSIKRAQQTLAHFKAYIDGKMEPTSSQQSRFDLGTVAHAANLEQSLDKVLKAPPMLTKDGKAAASPKSTSEWKDLVADNPDKIVLTEREFEVVHEMFNAFADNPIVNDLIKNAQVEHSLFTVDKDTGLWLKARPDILGQGYIADYKTCASVDLNDFEKAIGRAGYDISMSHYKFVAELLGKRVDDIFFICQEIKAPYSVRVFRLSDHDLKSAEERHRELLNRISVAFKDNYFPGYAAEVLEVGVRRFTEIEQDIFGEAI